MDDWHVMAAGFGCALLLLQCALYALFSSKLLPDGPWRAEPGFTAHQVIALPWVIYLTIEGGRAWFESPPLPGFDDPLSRTTIVHPTGQLLSQLAAGAVLIWDTPTCFAVKSLRNTEMIIHHILMAGAAYQVAVLPFMTYYASFFFGFIELSGIPLCIVDLMHPKHKPWVAYAAARPWLEGINNASRGLFVLGYFAVRIGMFPYYAFTGVIADAVALLRAETYPAVPLVTVIFFAASLTAMQIYWGYLIVKQLQKMAAGKGA